MADENAQDLTATFDCDRGSTIVKQSRVVRFIDRLNANPPLVRDRRTHMLVRFQVGSQGRNEVNNVIHHYNMVDTETVRNRIRGLLRRRGAHVLRNRERAAAIDEARQLIVNAVANDPEANGAADVNDPADPEDDLPVNIGQATVAVANATAAAERAVVMHEEAVANSAEAAAAARADTTLPDDERQRIERIAELKAEAAATAATHTQELDRVRVELTNAQRGKWKKKYLPLKKNL